jgi:tetratricopeptide (TPR) repeat protein
MIALLLALLPLALGQSIADRPASATAFDQLARQAEEARQANQADNAIALYRRALRLKVGWKEGWWYLGTLGYEQNHYADCRDAFRRVTVLEPKGAPAWSMLGLCEFEIKEYELALAHLNQGQQLGMGGTPEIDEIAKYHLALLLAREENYEKSLELFLDLARRGKDDQTMIAAAGMAALRKPLLPQELPEKEHEIAYLAGKAIWDLGGRRAADAQKDFELLLSKYPNVPNVHYLYGSFLLQEQPDKGIPELEKEIAISPAHVPARVQIASEYLRRGEPVKAMSYAREAARLAPDSVVTRTILGRLLVETGELDAGIRELELARKLAPESTQPHIALASAYAKMGRAEDAARERREFLRLKELYKQPGEQ